MIATYNGSPLGGDLVSVRVSVQRGLLIVRPLRAAPAVLPHGGQTVDVAVTVIKETAPAVVSSSGVLALMAPDGSATATLGGCTVVRRERGPFVGGLRTWVITFRSLHRPLFKREDDGVDPLTATYLIDDDGVSVVDDAGDSFIYETPQL